MTDEKTHRWAVKGFDFGSAWLVSPNGDSVWLSVKSSKAGWKRVVKDLSKFLGESQP